MSKNLQVRASRDGDQFHYLWAARRCLQLLAPTSGVVAITIEGSSPEELSQSAPIGEGEEKIDVAEYHASEDLRQATLVRYMQLKHSTLRSSEPWIPSELHETLNGFAERYLALRTRLGPVAGSKIEFWFISNRKVAPSLIEAAQDIACGAPPRHPAELKKLEQFTSLHGAEFSEFCGLLHFDDGQDAYWEQRNILTQETIGYLPDADSDAPTLLKDLIGRKATSEFASNPTIRQKDVLRVLKTDEGRLFPAPCLIAKVDSAVPREQEADLVRKIVSAGTPVIIHAGSGVGKSIFATRVGKGLPDGSFCLVYDCFGNGQYRSLTAYRHRHKDAFVQMANELAAQGLCHPLIPTPHADPADYTRAFLHRLKQAIASLQARRSGSMLCLAIDAADNAQIAADEAGDSRSFARDLLREQMPQDVRLVLLCRTHRQHLLYPPPNVLALPLLPFSRTETALHLRLRFPRASEQDVDEFHSLTSHNPRVQALALSQKASLSDILSSPTPTSVEDTIGDLLNHSVAAMRDAGGTTERTNVDRICQALATFRPLIPISALAAVSGVGESAITSFAIDLGRGLLVAGDNVQFIDEPTETWFREKYKPNATSVAEFISALRPLAARSAYVASALPQLLLEAGRTEELVTLALSSEALPEDNPIERREIELQRLQFALKATLRERRYSEAAKLALKTGGESAGHERQEGLLQANTDLAAQFIDTGGILEIVSRRTFGAAWFGSHFAYEAGIMSCRADLLGDARSKLRTAEQWLQNWCRLPKEVREREEVTDADIAELAMAHLNIHGAAQAARFLRMWTPRAVSFRSGRILSRRLVDHCRYADLDRLALEARNDVYLLLAVALEAKGAYRHPPADAVRRAIRLIASPRVRLEIPRGLDLDEPTIQALTALIEAGYRCSAASPSTLAATLKRYLPDFPPRSAYSRHLSSRSVYLRAYFLRAALAGEPLELSDLAIPELRESLQKGRDSDEVREFKEVFGALVPWYRLWTVILLGRYPASSLTTAIEDARSASSKTQTGYWDQSYTRDDEARIWFDCLVEAGGTSDEFIETFENWTTSLKRPLWVTTHTQIARLAARTEPLRAVALTFASRASELTREEREDAEEKIATHIRLSRAILPCGRREAQAYFDEAVLVASKVGDENLPRWAAMIDLADLSAPVQKSS